MSASVTRAQIVVKAREYLGTKFRHQGRVKGSALDCVGLPLMVAEEFGLLDIQGHPIRSRDSVDYDPQPLNNLVHEECQRRLIEKPIQDMQVGDVLTVKNPKIACHVAIIGTIGKELSMIHAHCGIGRVVEHRMDATWRSRILGCFAFPGVE